jgi:basic membrane protein A
MIRFDPEWGKSMKRYMGMFKVMALIVSLMMVVLGCSTGNTTTSSQTEAPKSTDGATAKPGDTKKIKMFFDTTGSRKDGSWSQSYFEAYELIKKNHPEVEAVFADMVAAADYGNVLEQQASSGADIIFTEDLWYEALVPVAPKYPNVKFVMAHLDEPRMAKLPDNVTSPNGNEAHAGYLAGIAAGLMTKTNKIALVVGTEGVAPCIRVGYAYFEGALSVNPKVQPIVAYTGDWVDVQKGYMTANTVISQGADVIMQFADNAGLGVLKAAQEKGVYVIGEAIDQSPLAPKQVLTSFLVPSGKLAEWSLEQFKAGGLKKEIKQFGLMDGWDVIAPLTNVPDDVKKKVEETQAKIKSGEIVVPVKTTREEFKKFEK